MKPTVRKTDAACYQHLRAATSAVFSLKAPWKVAWTLFDALKSLGNGFPGIEWFHTWQNPLVQRMTWYFASADVDPSAKIAAAVKRYATFAMTGSPDYGLNIATTGYTEKCFLLKWG